MNNRIKSRTKFIVSISNFNIKQTFMRIIRYLNALCGGNVHEKGVDNVSHSSIYDGINSFIYKFVVDFDLKDIYFCSGCNMISTIERLSQLIIQSDPGQKIQPMAII